LYVCPNIHILSGNRFTVLMASQFRPTSPGSSTLLILACFSFSLLSLFSLRAAAESPGLLFDYKRGIDSGGSFVDLSAAGPFIAQQGFMLSFDLSVFDPGQFGYVVRITDGTGSFCHLSYAGFPVPRIRVSTNFDTTHMGFTFDAAALRRQDWHRIALTLDRSANTLSLLVNGQSCGSSLIHAGLQPDVRIVFGQTRQTQEVPRMAVRDVHLSIPGNGAHDDTLHHHWPLDESEGEWAEDTCGGRQARAGNAEWLAPRHSQWRLRRVFPITVTDVWAFDSSEARFLLVGRERLREYSLHSDSVRETEFLAPRPAAHMVAMFDPVGRTLLCYPTGGGQVFQYEPALRAWLPQVPDSMSEDQFYEHVPFFDPVSGSLTTFGGYGWWRMKKTVRRWDSETQKWIGLSVSGDSIEPRRFSQFADALDQRGGYLFGGGGNASGLQEAGYRNFWDLWYLDCRAWQWHRLWQDTTDERRHLGAMGFLRVQEGGPLFILLRDGPHSPSPARLYHLSAERPHISPLGDELPLSTPQRGSSLWFDPVGRKLVAALVQPGKKGGAQLAVYTIDYPVHAPPLSIANRSAVTPGLYLAGIVLFMAGGTILVLVHRSRRRSAGSRKLQPSASDGRAVRWEAPSGQGPAFQEYTSGFYLFGPFTVRGSQGNELSQRFTPRLTQLFLAVLLGGRTNGDSSRGVTGERISELLWPDASPVSAKNSRNVALLDLRQILREVGSVHLVHEERRYHLRFDPACYCDLVRFLHIRDSLPRTESTTLLVEEMMHILTRGSFLPAVSYEWLEGFRSHVMLEAVRCLCGKDGGLEQTANMDGALLAFDAILSWDPLNEAAIRCKLRMLTKSGNHGEVKRIFEAFADRYRAEMGRPCVLTLPSILADRAD
jgi:hypothetical protein